MGPIGLGLRLRVQLAHRVDDQLELAVPVPIDGALAHAAASGHRFDREVGVGRYLVDDVEASIDYYTEHLGFGVLSAFPPAFADVSRGNLRLLLSGPTSSAARPMADGATPYPGGWNRIHLIVDDLDSCSALRGQLSAVFTGWGCRRLRGCRAGRGPVVGGR
jgi:hypothetical protein